MILAFLVVALISAALMVAFIRLTSVERLTQFLGDQQRSDMVKALAAYYAAKGSWDNVSADWREISVGAIQNSLPRPPGGVEQAGGQPGEAPPNERRWNLFGLASAGGAVLIPSDRGQQVGQQLSAAALQQGTPIEVGGVTVAVLLTTPRINTFNPEEALFLQRTNQAILYAGLAALVTAVVLGLIFARTLTRPLAALTQAAQQIARGNLEQQVAIRSQDEIGALASAFNTMSQEVSRGHQMRKQLTADIAHDLRTPLTVIAGYVESMRDGVLQPTPQRLGVIYAEIEQLQGLVGDLRTLTLAENGELALHPQEVSPRALLGQVCEVYEHRAGQKRIQLNVEADALIPTLELDESRMLQIFDNLLANALRYTPEGGHVVLGARENGRCVDLFVRDTGVGIPEEELPYIFNRFHRVDKSRHSDEGESGLGLAIVKAMVEAQGGQVWAESTLGEGSAVHMEFPVKGK